MKAKSFPVAVSALCALTVGGCTSGHTPTAAALAGKNSCAALSASQLGKLRLSTTGDPNADAAPDSGCSFDAVDPTAPTLGITFALGAHDSADGTKVFTVGHHTAYETTVPDVDQCEVDVAVGKDMAMIVGTGNGGPTTPECALAESAARLLEPALP
jgi:hypothetical protein